MIDIFSWNDFKLPKVIRRKLGKHRALGYQLKNKLHIDDRLQGKKLFEIEIHEFLHWMYPDKDEESIIKEARMLTEFLWSIDYRKMDNK